MPSLAVVCDPRDATAAELAAALAQRAPADFEVAVVAVDDAPADGAGGDVEGGKDYRRYEGLQGFAAVRAFLAELRRDTR